MADHKSTSPLVSIISGGVAGGVEAAATYPFEFNKTRLQLRSTAETRGAKPPWNPFQSILEIWRKEGTRAIYKGCGISIVGSIGKDAVRFLSFDSVKNTFKDQQTGNLSPLRTMLAGMTAGVIASATAVTPTERLKTALIDDARSGGQRRFTSTLHACKTIFAQDGFVGFYRGFVGTTLKQAGATSFRMGSYNILKDLETKKRIKQNTLMNFLNGSIAGTITTLTTMPFDCIKTRSQSSMRTTTIQAVVGICQDDGIKGFWRGTILRLGRTVLAGGILFTTAEAIRKLIEPAFMKAP